ncbi:type II toxin-antitoxin system RelE/ParE family toxin [Candidatus Pacearchaeota archaeon]|nr:type II toxin-antitoxin system RelE/ParE family toxin [Candidatus Pacearchaeota archaeon]
MSYRIVWDKKPKEFLEKLQRAISSRIYKKVNELTENPFRFLEHYEGEGYKLRVGDYRVLIDVDTSNKILNILKIGHRKNIYKE